MTIYYVGPSSAGSANGSSWANRLGTLNGAEDKPVVAGDTVYVGPGVYRELLTIDVSGSVGSPITYIADVSGENTDGIGGVVRITGSDNDTTATRANCITATSKNYRTFRGFAFDTSTNILVSLGTACGNWILEDCYFAGQGAAVSAIQFGGTGTTNTVRRCLFMGSNQYGVIFTHSSVVDNAAHLVENCIFIGTTLTHVRSDRIGGIAVKHNVFWSTGGVAALRVGTALTVGQTVTANNNLFLWCGTAMQAITAPATNEEITENYNNVWGCVTARSNVTAGANSQAYPPLFMPPILLAGIAYLKSLFSLSPWSPLRAIAGTSMSADDLTGITRPVTDSKKSWGAIQFHDISRNTTTKRTGAASVKLADAGRVQMFVPTSNVSTTFSVYVQYEANYAGVLPSMLIRQPGQSTTTVTAVGASGSWELLTATLTPAASPGYVVVDLRSSNTAAAGSFACYFDDLVIT